jgi:hypothetical protein
MKGQRANAMRCTKCGNNLRRVPRKGFLQTKLYPIFGFYPWECAICRYVVLKKKQYMRKSRPAEQDYAE